MPGSGGHFFGHALVAQQGVQLRLATAEGLERLHRRAAAAGLENGLPVAPAGVHARLAVRALAAWPLASDNSEDVVWDRPRVCNRERVMRLILIGPPGSGRSLVLAQIAWRWVQASTSIPTLWLNLAQDDAACGTTALL